MSVYAVIHTGGKQYRVSPGDGVTVEKLSAEEGEQVELDQVYLLAHDGQIIAGDPLVKNARVIAQVVGQKRDRKLIIFKHRRRKGYRNSTGHRQNVTLLRIIEIVHEGASYAAPVEKKAVVPKQVTEKKELPAKTPQKGKKKRDKQAAVVTKTESAARPERTAAEATITPPPAPADDPKPVKQPPVPEAPPTVVAEKREDAPIREPDPPAASEPSRPVASAAAAADERTRREQPAAPSPASSNRGKVVAAVLAALVLLALLLLGRDRSPTATVTPLEAADTAVPAEKPKQMPPAPEVGTKRTAPAGKPEAPAQPPD